MKAVDDLVADCLKIADYYIDQFRFKKGVKVVVRQKIYSRIKRLDLVGLQIEVIETRRRKK